MSNLIHSVGSNPSAVAGAPVAVTSSSLLQLSAAGLGNGPYAWAVVTNNSPWVFTVNSAQGTTSINPYTIDMLPSTPSGQLQGYMSIPPGGAATAPSGQLTFVQVDWYLASGAEPPGSYPVAITPPPIPSNVPVFLGDFFNGPTSGSPLVPPSYVAGVVCFFSVTHSGSPPTGNTATNVYVVGEDPDGYPVQLFAGELPSGETSHYGTGPTYGLVQQFNPITFPVPPGITAIYFATVNLGGDATGWFASFYGTPESLPCSVVPLLGSEGYVNKVEPLTALQVAGSDGVALRTLLTDATGKLITSTTVSLPDPLPTEDASDGTVGSAVPTIAGLIGASDGTDLRAVSSNASGQLQVETVAGSVATVEGTAASGAVPVGNPVLVAGFDGTDVRDLSTDTSGRQIVVGGAATGAVPVGNPVLVAGFDGFVVRDLTVVPAGAPVGATAPTTIVGGTDGTDARALTLVAPGAAAPADILCVMPGFDGTDERQLATDTSGRQIVVGGAATGAVPVGNPVLVAGFDGTDVRDLTVVPAGSAVSATAPTTIVGGTDGTDARALTLVAPGAAAPADILCVMPGFDGTDERQLATDTSGRQIVVGGAATGAVPVGNPVLVAGFDGTDVRDLATDTSGRLVLPPATGSLSTFTSISTSSGGDALFGVIGSAINGKGGTLSVGIYSYTQTAGQELLISLQSTGAGGPGVLATLIVPLVGTAVAGAGVFIVVPLDFGAGGITIPSNGGLGALGDRDPARAEVERNDDKHTGSGDGRPHEGDNKGREDSRPPRPRALERDDERLPGGLCVAVDADREGAPFAVDRRADDPKEGGSPLLVEMLVKVLRDPVAGGSTRRPLVSVARSRTSVPSNPATNTGLPTGTAPVAAPPTTIWRPLVSVASCRSSVPSNPGITQRMSAGAAAPGATRVSARASVPSVPPTMVVGAVAETAAPAGTTVRSRTTKPSNPATNTGLPTGTAPAAAPPTTIRRPLVSVLRSRTSVPSNPATSTGFPTGTAPLAAAPSTVATEPATVSTCSCPDAFEETARKSVPSEAPMSPAMVGTADPTVPSEASSVGSGSGRETVVEVMSLPVASVSSVRKATPSLPATCRAVSGSTLLT